jgi:hypothetical protein
VKTFPIWFVRVIRRLACASILCGAALAEVSTAPVAGPPSSAPVVIGRRAGRDSRDWRKWPFSRRSPWNHPIGSAAHYEKIRGIESVACGINHDGRWTSAVVVATDSDPTVTLLFSPGYGSRSTWTFLDGGGKNCGNSASTERWLSGAATTRLAFEGNYYSTISAVSGTWSLPADFHHASDDAHATFHLPRGACPSPDSDGLLAVFQPDGWVVDVYATVVTSDHKVLGTMASWIDARGDGTGWWNGRRASMIPSFAGLIRSGEIAAGRIPHALAAQAPPSMLAMSYVWPAAAFDRNANYTGTLPMGALLAIPASVNIDELKLSWRGKAIARAAQDYGVYVVDRGGGGLTLLAELGNPDISWQGGGEPSSWQDLELIKSLLQRVANNGPVRRGGGGRPRVPFAPSLLPR